MKFCLIAKSGDCAAGGLGKTNCITGSPVTYAGGGGGGAGNAVPAAD